MCLESEGLEGEEVREIELADDLLLLEGIVIENDTLQVHYQHIRHASKKLALLYCHELAAATLTTIVFNCFTINELLDGRAQVSLILDLHG